jgi:hypothetical protein
MPTVRFAMRNFLKKVKLPKVAEPSQVIREIRESVVKQIGPPVELNLSYTFLRRVSRATFRPNGLERLHPNGHPCDLCKTYKDCLSRIDPILSRIEAKFANRKSARREIHQLCRAHTDVSRRGNSPLHKLLTLTLSKYRSLFVAQNKVIYRLFRATDADLYLRKLQRKKPA